MLLVVAESASNRELIVDIAGVVTLGRWTVWRGKRGILCDAFGLDTIDEMEGVAEVC